jgi:hypothetical protein
MDQSGQILRTVSWLVAADLRSDQREPANTSQWPEEERVRWPQLQRECSVMREHVTLRKTKE